VGLHARSFTWRYRSWAPILVVCLGTWAAPAPAALITFSEQPDGDGPMSPAVYTSAHGLPAGVTASFAGFFSSELFDDHTASNSDNKLVYGTGSSAQIDFNSAVLVPTVWVSTSFAALASQTVVGSLGGVTKFTYVLKAADKFENVTLGAGVPIDRLSFSNYADSVVDDLTVTVPEPGGAAVAAAVVGLVLGSRRTRRAGTGPGSARDA
jgi:hypothetical protein